MSKNSIYVIVGRNVQYFRKNRQLSQLELSLRANVDRSYIAKLELGKVNPSIRILNHIAAALNIPLYYLVRTNNSKSICLRKFK